MWIVQSGLESAFTQNLVQAESPHRYHAYVIVVFKAQKFIFQGANSHSLLILWKYHLLNCNCALLNNIFLLWGRDDLPISPSLPTVTVDIPSLTLVTRLISSGRHSSPSLLSHAGSANVIPVFAISPSRRRRRFWGQTCRSRASLQCSEHRDEGLLELAVRRE